MKAIPSNATSELRTRCIDETPVRLLTLLEANSISGPAKAFIEFCSVVSSQSLAPGVRAVEAIVLGFRREGKENGSHKGRTGLNQALDTVAVPHLSVTERFRFDPGVVSRLISTAQALQPDIIESHSLKSHAVVWASRIWRRIPWVAYHHGYTDTDFKVHVYNQADRFSLRAADRVVTVAKAFVPVLVGRGVHRDRIRVVHSALTPPSRIIWDRGAARTSLGIADSIPVVLSLGRLSREKSVNDLLRAFGVILDKRHEALLIIAGDGPERARLEPMARESGILNNCRFVGHVFDARKYFAAADVFVMASLSEGSPYTLLEALAAGVPTVATRAGGIPEMVSDGVHALLTPPKDPGRLALAIERLLSDPEESRRLATNGRNHVEREFSSEARAQRLLELYAEVLTERATASRSRR